MSKIRHDTIARIVPVDTSTGEPEITHHCLAGPRCRAPETADNKRQPAITEKPNTVCRRCFSAIRIAVEDLPQDRADLLAALDEHQRIGGDKVHGSSNSSQSPIDLTKHDLARDIETQLRIAAARVRAARVAGHATTCRCAACIQDPPRTIRECANLIGKHLPLLITSPKQDEQEWCGAGESVLIDGRYYANTRTVQRAGIDTAMRLVELRSKARARLNGVTTSLWRLPAQFDGCITCGEQLYTNGHKVVCRACDKDWTEQTAGLFNAEIRRQAEIERAQHVEQLAWCLAEAQHQRDEARQQRDTAWLRLDRAARLAEAIRRPDYAAVTAHQFGQLLAEILDGHPTPHERQTTSEEPA